MADGLTEGDFGIVSDTYNFKFFQQQATPSVNNIGVVLDTYSGREFVFNKNLAVALIGVTHVTPSGKYFIRSKDKKNCPPITPEVGSPSYSHYVWLDSGTEAWGAPPAFTIYSETDIDGETDTDYDPVGMGNYTQSVDGHSGSIYSNITYPNWGGGRIKSIWTFTMDETSAGIMLFGALIMRCDETRVNTVAGYQVDCQIAWTKADNTIQNNSYSFPANTNNSFTLPSGGIKKIVAVVHLEYGLNRNERTRSASWHYSFDTTGLTCQDV